MRRALPGLLALVLLACGGASVPSGAGGHLTLRLGYLPNLTHAPALAGVRRGFFADKLGVGVTLRPVTFNAGPDTVEALLSGSIDAAYLGPNPALNAHARSHGRAVRIVSGATSGGASLVVRPGIEAVTDMKGKVLATPQLGNTQDVALRSWLASRGLRADLQGGGDVSIQPQDNAQTLQAFRIGKIDGAWVPEPWATRMVIEGGGRLFLDERDLWPNGRFVTTLLMVRADFLQQHRDVVEDLLEGQVATDEYLHQQPGGAQRLVNDALADISGKRLPDQVVGSAWDRLEFTEDPIATSLRDSAERAEKLGLLPRVDLRGIYDLSLLNAVLTRHGQPAVRAL